MTILITGGTGSVGKNLTRVLIALKYKVIILTRSLLPQKEMAGVTYAIWDIKNKQIDLSALSQANVIIHLAGAGVMDHRWTKAYQQEIIDSRVKGLEFIIDQLKSISHNVHSLISASAIGWYGGDNTLPYEEELPAAPGFLGETCMKWEAAADKASDLNIRVVKLRTGIVLAEQGGAYSEFKKSLAYGVASILGNGKQVVSWIDIEDLCRMYVHAIEQNLHGAYNAVAPTPVSNKILTLTIAGLTKKYYIPVHVPALFIKILFGKRSLEILKSADVSCKKIKQTGFTFLYPSIEASVKHLEKL